MKLLKGGKAVIGVLTSYSKAAAHLYGVEGLILNPSPACFYLLMTAFFFLCGFFVGIVDICWSLFESFYREGCSFLKLIM